MAGSGETVLKIRRKVFYRSRGVASNVFYNIWQPEERDKNYTESILILSTSNLNKSLELLH